MARILLLAALALSACVAREYPMAVDQCLLKEYQQECDVDPEMTTPEETAACMKRAPLEAIRPAGGIAAQCRAG